MTADPHVIASLQDKAHSLRAAIVSYEEHLDRSRKELAIVTATITIFQRDAGRITDTRPASVRNLFKRGEVIALCREALAGSPDGLSTRDLAVACLRARDFDHDDPVLVRAMVGLLSNTLKKAVRRKEMTKGGEARKPVWQLQTNGGLS